jgi:hypothetical protein
LTQGKQVKLLEKLPKMQKGLEYGSSGKTPEFNKQNKTKGYKVAEWMCCFFKCQLYSACKKLLFKDTN